MDIQYNIYSNDGIPGDPIDEATPMATTAATTLVVTGILPGDSWDFLVRTIDQDTGLEEDNKIAIAHVIIDADNNDSTLAPAVASDVSVRATPAGTAIVTWNYNPAGIGDPPEGFHIYIGEGVVDFDAPVATVPYLPGSPTFRASLDSLADGTDYAVAIVAYNDHGVSAPSAVAPVVGSLDGPQAVTDLTATVVA
jgi:hypothetical protein